MSRSPLSDAAANGPNAQEELYKLCHRLERENAKLRELLRKMHDAPADCSCEVSDQVLAIWKEAGDLLLGRKEVDMTHVSPAMREAGERIADILTTASVRQSFGASGIGGCGSLEEFLGGLPAFERGLAEDYVAGRIVSVEAIYLAMQRQEGVNA